METTPHSLLVVEDSPEYAQLVVTMLKATFGQDLKVERTHLAGDGAQRLATGSWIACCSTWPSRMPTASRHSS